METKAVIYVPRKILIYLKLLRDRVLEAPIELPILKVMFKPLVWPLDIVMVSPNPCGSINPCDSVSAPRSKSIWP